MLVTLTQAFRQLRIFPNPDDEEEVAFQANLATGIVLDYIKDRDNENGWTDATAPAPIQAAILIVLSDLWDHRAGSASNDVLLSEAVVRLLHRWRDPALA